MYEQLHLPHDGCSELLEQLQCCTTAGGTRAPEETIHHAVLACSTEQTRRQRSAVVLVAAGAALVGAASDPVDMACQACKQAQQLLCDRCDRGQHALPVCLMVIGYAPAVLLRLPRRLPPATFCRRPRATAYYDGASVHAACGKTSKIIANDFAIMMWLARRVLASTVQPVVCTCTWEWLCPNRRNAPASHVDVLMLKLCSSTALQLSAALYSSTAPYSSTGRVLPPPPSPRRG
jgi:hypothetical protein